jgi:hypothetical protein
MPRAKRNKPYNPAQAHDRRALDLLHNAEVAPVEVDDPFALEPGDKIVTLRSLRNYPLGRLHSRRQIDEAQYQGGSILRATISVVGGLASRSPKGSARRCCG